MTDLLCPVLVGREAELAALRAALDAALRGRGRLACLTGEPGIGKSRLARELAGLAHGRGALVITGRAVPAGSSTPYRPFTEALLQAQRRGPWPADEEAARWWPALDVIIPGVPDGTRPGAGRPGPGMAGREQVSAAVRGEAVLRLLGGLAVPAGLVMLLEDLHWADPDTLAVLEYLADNLGGQPVLGLVTCRLCLSPRTVEKHVESLLRKTGTRTRTQLAGYAVQVGRGGGAGRDGPGETT